MKSSQARLKKIAPPVCPGSADHHRRRIGHILEARFAFMKGGLCMSRSRGVGDDPDVASHSTVGIEHPADHGVEIDDTAFVPDYPVIALATVIGER